MAKLIITKGLPGSGKSFFAKKLVADNKVTFSFKGITFEFVRRINKDDIRRELEAEGWVWSRENEKDVVRRQEALIKAAFVEGADTVICDDTNFGKHEARLNQLADKLNVKFEVEDFTDIPIDLCIQRDMKREGKAQVGEKVIRDTAEANLRPEQLVRRTGSPQLFLDLDGVFADFDGFIERELGIPKYDRSSEPPDFWDRIRSYAGRLYRDMGPFPHTAELYERLSKYHPVILTGCPYSLPTAAQDKRDWVAKYINPDVQVVTCKSRNKSNYLIPGDVLLDDSPHHAPAWEAKGGVWITFTGDVDLAVAQVEEALSGWSAL